MEGGPVQANYVFRGIEYIVTMMVAGDVLEVQVEDRLTSEQWRGEFEAVYIEDVTHKTGNFKQFSIFCNMLESAITKSSESVTLDLLTYSDLEMLRNRKAGVGMRQMAPPKSGPLSAKRYLILIYSVEFDRIHYPLPLPYTGKPDPVALQKVIRELKEELARMRSKQGTEYRDSELRRLRADLFGGFCGDIFSDSSQCSKVLQFDKLLQEKQELEVTILQLQEQVKLSNTATVAKDIKILKKVIQGLEQELLKEKTKNQRAASKRNQEFHQALDELEEVKSSERKLKLRVKNLTIELGLYKKGRLTPLGPSPQNRSNFSVGSGRHSQGRTDSATRLREDSLSASENRSKKWSGSRERKRSTSRERSGQQTSFREVTRSSSRERQQGNRCHVSKLTPSPTGIRQPRFDPTAYVHEKERRRKDADQRNLRKIHRNMNGLTGDGRGRPRSGNWSREGSGSRMQATSRIWTRSSSAENLRFSSASSVSDFEDSGEPAKSRLENVRKPRRPLGSASWISSNLPQRKQKPKRLASTPTRSNKASDKENYLDSCDLSEIDARLNALQEYMKKLGARTE
ncbi:centrosomal protein CCDC61 isoform X2 [Narcine bancroftii]|uniref:centrosomal protein CCDC61 isoform X2 n=1 Tax=Narcine bancroftii TaxID=1343680 RepID=UPI0038316D34